MYKNKIETTCVTYKEVADHEDWRKGTFMIDNFADK